MIMCENALETGIAVKYKHKIKQSQQVTNFQTG